MRLQTLGPCCFILLDFTQETQIQGKLIKTFKVISTEQYTPSMQPPMLLHWSHTCDVCLARKSRQEAAAIIWGEKVVTDQGDCGGGGEKK